MQNNKRLTEQDDESSSLSFKDSIQLIQDYKNNNPNTKSHMWMNILYDQLCNIRFSHAQHHNTTEMMDHNESSAYHNHNKRNKFSSYHRQPSSSYRQHAYGYNTA
jgi:hypothetical protein